MSYWNKDKDKKRSNWNQSLKSTSKINKPKNKKKFTVSIGIKKI